MPTNADVADLLAGAVVQRADVAERVALLKVRLPGETTYLLVVAGAGIGLSATRVPRPEGARAQARLEGLRIARVTASGVILARDEEQRAIAVEGGRVVVREPSESDRALPAARTEERDAWLARGVAMARAVAEGALAALRSDAGRAVKKGIARLERRAVAVRGDMARIGDAEALAAQAQWLVAEAARAPRGARSLSVTDWSTGEPRVLEVPLDPAKPAKDQVQAMFQRARRLKLGARIAEERLQHTERALAQLRAAALAIAEAPDAAAIEASVATARAAAPKDVAFARTTEPGEGRAARGQQAKSPPHRTFRGRSGARILVGRGAAQNDALTFQIARPHDLWLHAKGRTGAHVIVPLLKNHSCPGDVLVEAAHLAAHFSDARDEAVVDVQYASRRHLRKPRGSAAGLVLVDREKVLALRKEPDVMRALLESEE